MEIAAVARERQVFGAFEASVLLCGDVLHMMPQFAMFLGWPAILALGAGPAAHQLSRFLVHVLLNFRIQMKTSLELQDGDEIRCVNQRLIFGALALAERAFVGPRGKGVNPFLHLRINVEINNPAGGLCIEASA